MVRSRSTASLLVFAAAAALSVRSGLAIDFGPTFGSDYAGEDYNITRWHSPSSESPNNWYAAMKKCEAYCLADSACCTWTYVTPENQAQDPERCCLKDGVPQERHNTPTHWTGAAPRAATTQCQDGPPFPGPAFQHPAFHWSPNCLHVGGWHDIAASLSLPGSGGGLTHHVMEGCPASGGWHHSSSEDLVHWTDLGIDVRERMEWGTNSSPCSGFLVQDDETGDVCAGFRQCSSSQGIGKPWNVPLELRCASNSSLTSFGADEDMFDFFWARSLPYDPVRPWKDTDGRWYATISTDACNKSSTPCDAGGALQLYSSTKLRGAGASWSYVGVLFASNVTVLEGASLQREFVTSDYFGSVPGDPSGRRRVFTNNVAGNGCCSGTTGYFVGTQPAGKALAVDYSDPNAVGMIDWGAFVPSNDGRIGRDALTGTGARGFSMARTLGSRSPNQVAEAGRRVMIGWVGQTPAVQSLPRDISFGPGGELLQAFVPELAALRQSRSNSSMQLEVVARFSECAGPVGFTVMRGPGDPGADIVVNASRRLFQVGGRAGPIQDSVTDPYFDYSIHAYVDHGIITAILNNRTALTVSAPPKAATSEQLVPIIPSGGCASVSIEGFELASTPRGRAARA